MSLKFPLSDHCDGTQFYNLESKSVGNKSLVDLLKWKFASTRRPWPSAKLQDLCVSQLQAPLQNGDLRITFINHASFLIQWKNINVLSDPVFCEKLGPFQFLNLKRYRDVGIAFERLPKIDCVFLSHNHYDHLDLPTLKKLQERDASQFVVPLGVGRYLSELGGGAKLKISELDWHQMWHDEKLGLEVFLTPAQHWSKRSLSDSNTSLWGAALFRAQGQSVYFAGDTGYASHFTAIAAQFGAVDVALLPIGAYEPRWFMKDAHMNPDDAVRAHKDLRAKCSIAMHFGSFRLTDEAIEDPVKDLNIALDKFLISPDEFKIPKNGQSFYFAKT